MHIGHYISGTAHVGLVGWLLFGSVFDSDPPVVDVTEVAVFTEEQFAALTRPALPDVAPEPELEVQPVEPVAPDPLPDPVVIPEPDPAPVVEPEPEPEVQREPVPEVPEPPQPDEVPLVVPEPPAEPEVQPEAPVLVAPEEPVVVPEPDVAPVASIRPRARPAPRVAPEPVEAPEPDVQVGALQEPAAEPDEAAEEVVPEEEEQAPEEAATEIVTEAEEAPGEPLAPAASLRPKARPRPQVAEAEPEVEEAAPQEPDTAAAVQEALAAALGEPATDPIATSSQPLTSGESDALRLAVQDCWVVDVGSQAANVTVVVGMDMERSGRVIASTIRLVSATGGSGEAAQTAFQAARRAILRCQKDGYPLPVEKFDQWQEIEMTFNPSRMRIR